MTLGGLLKHLAHDEDGYFSGRLFGRALGPPWDAMAWDALRLMEDRPSQIAVLPVVGVAGRPLPLRRFIKQTIVVPLSQFLVGSPGLRRTVLHVDSDLRENKPRPSPPRKDPGGEAPCYGTLTAAPSPIVDSRR
jgi:hypothetical protein